MHDLYSHKTCILISEANWNKYRITTGCCDNCWKYTMEEAKVKRPETQSDKNKNKSRVCRNSSCGGHPDLAHIVDQRCIRPQCNMTITKDREWAIQEGNQWRLPNGYTKLPLLSIIPFFIFFFPHLSIYQDNHYPQILSIYYISWQNTNLISLTLVIDRCHCPLRWE